ncbi:MAG: NUDIX hydrolase, partial [Pseudonocardiales bacterium]|nr:NUDIX hydrolase [Pseudonocardiales bacterium]
AAAARAAGRPGPWDAAREDAENALGRALGRLDRSALPAPVAAELADAERLVVLGRAVHNDAVRDALALRTRRLVRLLRLAGTAPVPAYVEFAADPPPP